MNFRRIDEQELPKFTQVVREIFGQLVSDNKYFDFLKEHSDWPEGGIKQMLGPVASAPMIVPFGMTEGEVALSEISARAIYVKGEMAAELNASPENANNRKYALSALAGVLVDWLRLQGGSIALPKSGIELATETLLGGDRARPWGHVPKSPDANGLRITPLALKMIKHHEKLKLEAYDDQAGVWTIGYGHSSRAGSPPVPKPGMVISKNEAENILIKDVKKFETAVLRSIKVAMNDFEFGAMVSLCFNVGAGGFSSSRLARKFNADNKTGTIAEFANWDKYTDEKGVKRVSKGLQNRRKKEIKFFKGDTSWLNI